MLERIKELLKNYPLGLTAAEVAQSISAEGKKVRERDVYPMLRDNFRTSLPNKDRFCVGDAGFVFPEKPSRLPVTYLANRSVKVRGADDKVRIRKMGKLYHNHGKYSVNSGSFLKAFKDTCQRGHQLVLGGFYRRLNRNRKLSIKSRECLAYVQVIMVEFDEDLGYGSLQEMAEQHEFIRENAVLLMESTSGFPKCRAFFALPAVQTTGDEEGWAQTQFLIRMLLSEFDGKADANGSNPTNGCFGRVDGEYVVIDKWVQQDVLKRWAALWREEPKRTPQSTHIADSDLKQLPKAYRDALQTATADAHGWFGRFPCPHVEHTHDGWDGGSNACSIRPQGRGFVTACWKCQGDEVGKPKYRYIGKSRAASTKTTASERISEAYKAEETFVQRILDGTLEIPEPLAKPTFEELEESKRRRVRAGQLSPLELSRPKVMLQKGIWDKSVEWKPSADRAHDVLNVINSPEYQAVLKQAFLKDARLVVLDAPTGAGKDETHMTVVLDYNLHSIETKPHHRVAREKVERWQQLSASAAHWTGILHGREIVEAMEWENRLEDPFPEDGSWKCIQPSKVWAYMQQGGNRHYGICLDCPARDACYDIGFNGQAKYAREQRAIVTAIPDLFTNPIYESFSEKLYVVPKADDDEESGERTLRLAVMDEVEPTNLFLDCELTLGQLQTWRVMWESMELHAFATKLETILIQGQGLETLAEYLESIDDELSGVLNRQMSRVRTPYRSYRRETGDSDTGEVLSKVRIVWPNGNEAYLALDEAAYRVLREKELPALIRDEVEATGCLELDLDVAFHLGVYGNPAEMDAEEIKSALPKVYSETWTPLKQLQTLFSRYPVDGAPMHFKKEALVWEIPPQVHGHLQKLLCMSATVDEVLFRRAMSEYDENLEFVSVPPTPLMEGSRIFQIRTGKYCRGTVLKWDNTKQPVGLKRAGENLWDMFVTEVERDSGVTHALITYQCILEWNAEWLDTQPNVLAYANYWGLEGINEMQDADYLWVMFDPELDGNTIERYAKRFWGDDEEPLNFDREDGYYLDERVRRVWKSQVLGELLQAVGRARLNRTQGNVVVLTGLDIPTVTNREETMLFDLADWELDGKCDEDELLHKDLGNRLAHRITQRETHETIDEQHKSLITAALERGESIEAISKSLGVNSYHVRQMKMQLA